MPALADTRTNATEHSPVRFACSAGELGSCPRLDEPRCCQDCTQWGACYVMDYACRHVWWLGCKHKREVT